MSAEVVLYDLPGPRARRRALIGTVVVLALAAALAYVVVRRLADRGQFEAELWTPLISPTHENFVRVWELLGQGLLATLMAAALAIVASLAIGTLLGSTRILLSASPKAGLRALRLPLVGGIELFRGLPVVPATYFAYTVLPELGLDFRGWPGGNLMWYVVIGLTAYNSVVIAEILRAGVASLPRGQAEAARAIGMTEGVAMRLVLLPQAFRVMLPALISQLVVILKDTSLGYFIGYQETLWRGLRLSQNFDNPIQTLLVVGLLFIGLNYLLSLGAVRLERRLSRTMSGAVSPTV